MAAYWGARLLAFGLRACLTLAAATLTLAGASPPIEYQVKAAILYNFSRFVEWPEDAFQSENAPINFCVFQHDPFGGALDKIIRGKTIRNRQLVVRRVSEVRDLRACQLVFAGETDNERLPDILKELKGTSTLLVGESEEFAERGGGIQLHMEDNKMRFSVNVDAIQRARLTVSSKLLALARIVHGDSRLKKE
jgi:hypothetical protein